MNYSDYIDLIYKKIMTMNVCIFGAGGRGKECYRVLTGLGVKVDCVFDNSAEKVGTYIEEAAVEKPVYRKGTFVIKTVLNHYMELDKQLDELGYVEADVCSFEDIMVVYIEKKDGDQEEKCEKVLEYPFTIQLPITHLCNFDCVMCGMHEMIREKDFSVEELDKILKDKLFSQVKGIGINGGEPFMRKDLVECVSTMLKNCVKLEAIYFISNGYFTDTIISMLKEIKRRCQEYNVRVNLSISVDAVGELQDFHRGKKGAFKNADSTCRKIIERKEELVDYLDIICTITNYNVENLNEVAVWAEEVGVDVSYNIATENVRIYNQSKFPQFSILQNPHAKMLAMEFFYNEYQKTKKEKYYALYLFLRDGKRYAECPCKSNEWITLTPDAQIGLCATRSKKLGSALETSAYELVHYNIAHLQEIKDQYCEACSHYAYQLNVDGMRELLKEKMKIENMEWNCNDC